jgi:signal transduction histidine kinase
MTGAHFVTTEFARVLVADDDPILREFATVHLATPNVDVEVAEDGLVALERLRCGGIDIALVDLDMPHMNGFELIEAIRADAMLMHLPVVVITGREDMEAIDRAYALGASSFVVKPLNWRLLSHQLAYVLRASRAADEVRHAHAATQAAEAFKTNLLRLMRHEFNTPFNVIQGYAGLIAAHASDPTIQSQARQILGASKAFKRVHDDLFEAARLLAGDAGVTHNRFAVADCIKTAAGQALEKTGIASDLRLVDRTGNAEISGDFAIVTRCLRNIIENALTHGVKPVVVVAERCNEKSIHFKVSDKGNGFAEADLSVLTQPFSQVQSALNRESGGLGLGLATAKSGLDAIGGNLSIISDDPQSFTLQLTIPAIAA